MKADKLTKGVAVAALMSALMMGSAGAATPPDVAACTANGKAAEQMADCLQGLIDKADSELKDRLQRALAAIDAPSQALFKTAQRDWEAFRVADIAANNGPWRSKHGTELRLAAMTNTITAIRERSDEIERLYLGEKKR